MRVLAVVAVAAGVAGFASAASAAAVTINSLKTVGGSSQTYTTGADGYLQFPGPSGAPAFIGLQRPEDPVYLPPGFLSPPPRAVAPRKVIRYTR